MVKIHLRRERSFVLRKAFRSVKEALVDGNRFLLLYKRFEAGRLSWPRNIQEAADLTEEQYKYLMMGLNPWIPKSKMSIRKYLLKRLYKKQKIFSVWY